MKDLKKIATTLLGISNVIFFAYLFLQGLALAYIAILFWSASLVLLALGNRQENKHLRVIDWVYIIVAAALAIFVIWSIIH